MTQTQIIAQAVAHYGHSNQVLQAIEEMNELCVELTHHLRGRNGVRDVAEEIADCMIMMRQLRLMFGEQLVDWFVDEKLDRLQGRLEEV